MLERKKRRIWLWIVLLVVILAACGGFLYIRDTYTVKNVYVNGNVHYSDEEIKDIVMTGFLGDNSLYLSLRYRNKGVEDVPFVDVMDVTIVSPDTIAITVYEKALAGCISYMDTYIYFDKDGYVVECSDEPTSGVPVVTGLSFDYVVLGELLPVEDKDIFDDILEITKLLEKYELSVDKIFFHSSGEVTLYFGGVKVALGDDFDQLENKMRRLPELLSRLEGMSGTLRMENLTEDNTDVTFQKDEETDEETE